MDIPILYEDDDCLIINKPPGIVVNKAQSVKGETIQDWAKAYLHMGDAPVRTQIPVAGEIDDVQEFYDRNGVVHRLDKETSGILVIAKNPSAYIHLKNSFKERLVQKTYCAFVHGDLVPDSGEISAPVGRLPWNPERFGIVPGGKDAVTNYQKVSVIQHGLHKEPISFIKLFPHTGRTHQIRVHLKYINHPIVGDFVYAGRKVSREDRLWVPRVMLHALSISIPHPRNPTPLEIEAPIPDDMSRLLK